MSPSKSEFSLASGRRESQIQSPKRMKCTAVGLKTEHMWEGYETNLEELRGPLADNQQEDGDYNQKAKRTRSCWQPEWAQEWTWDMQGA